MSKHQETGASGEIGPEVMDSVAMGNQIYLAGPCMMCLAGAHDECVHGKRDARMARLYGEGRRAVFRCPCGEKDHFRSTQSDEALQKWVDETWRS